MSEFIFGGWQKFWLQRVLKPQTHRHPKRESHSKTNFFCHLFHYFRTTPYTPLRSLLILNSFSWTGSTTTYAHMPPIMVNRRTAMLYLKYSRDPATYREYRDEKITIDKWMQGSFDPFPDGELARENKCIPQFVACGGCKYITFWGFKAACPKCQRRYCARCFKDFKSFALFV